MKPSAALERLADIFYATVPGNPYLREKEVSVHEWESLAERVSLFALEQTLRERSKGEGSQKP